MSGVVGVFQPSAVESSAALAALDLLGHLDQYTTSVVGTTGGWLGTCGRPGLHGTAVAGDMARGRVAAAIGGDVLNLEAIARELDLCSDPSAAEVVIDAYRRWGAGLFDRLEGAFSLVVHDATQGLVLAGGDPDALGSMFAATASDGVWLASEAKAFLAAAGFRARLDERALAELMTVGWPLEGRGLFEGVLGLPLGCHFEIRAGRLSLQRHWDERGALGGRLRGRAYVARMREAITEICAETFAQPDVLVPLTGGVDARLIVAAMPREAKPQAFTFGTTSDADVRRGAQIAAVRGLPYRLFELEPDYVSRFAHATVWLSEGRTNPTGNITGCLMDRVGSERFFVTGIGGALGRRFLKCRNMIPDRWLLSATGMDFERRFFETAWHPQMDVEQLASLFGRNGIEYALAGRKAIEDALAMTRGLSAIDRLEHYIADADGWEERPGLAIAGTWITPRAPLHTRRWYEAVLAGAPSERMDDLARLRLIRELDCRVARVPWVLTHLPLAPSEPLLHGLRAVSWVSWKLASQGKGDHTARILSLPAQLKHAVYSHGERRDDWLRERGRSFMTDVLLSERAADRSLVRADGVRLLLDEQAAGADHARPLGQLLNIELWHRLFVDGELGREAMAPWRCEGG